MTHDAPSALIISRDPMLAYLCQSVLTGLGWRTEIQLNNPVPDTPHDLYLLDMDDPRAESAARRASRIIGITANTNPQHRWRLIENGFADYLLKPFPPSDLAQRVTFAIQQMPLPQQIGSQQFDPLRAALIKNDGTTRTLTHAETALLERLLSAKGRTLTVDMLSQGICTSITSLRTLIHRLRRHLETDPSHPAHLLTRPEGYCLHCPPQPQANSPVVVDAPQTPPALRP